MHSEGCVRVAHFAGYGLRATGYRPERSRVCAAHLADHARRAVAELRPLAAQASCPFSLGEKVGMRGRGARWSFRTFPSDVHYSVVSVPLVERIPS